MVNRVNFSMSVHPNFKHTLMNEYHLIYHESYSSFFVGADPNCKDYDCRTPLHSAIVKGSRSYDCVRLLLDGGADVNHKDRYVILESIKLYEI